MSRLNGRRAEAEAQGLRVNVAILGPGVSRIRWREHWWRWRRTRGMPVW